jgi:hypothetical protein
MLKLRPEEWIPTDQAYLDSSLEARAAASTIANRRVRHLILYDEIIE